MRLVPQVLVCALLMILSGAAAHAAEPHNVSASKLKAAFVFHLFHFTSWPDSSTPSWKVCAWPGYAGIDELQSIHGKKVRAKEVEVSRCSSQTCDSDCHIVLLPDYQTEASVSYLKQISTAPVLTMTNETSELADDARIHFFHDQRQLRMAIDYQATEKAGIQISSRLLRLMRVNGSGGAGR